MSVLSLRVEHVIETPLVKTRVIPNMSKPRYACCRKSFDEALKWRVTRKPLCDWSSTSTSNGPQALLNVRNGLSTRIEVTIRRSDLINSMSFLQDRTQFDEEDTRLP